MWLPVKVHLEARYFPKFEMSLVFWMLSMGNVLCVSSYWSLFLCVRFSVVVLSPQKKSTQTHNLTEKSILFRLIDEMYSVHSLSVMMQ